MRIFLSYAHGDDPAFVQRLHTDLTEAGFKVWLDRESLLSRSLSFHQEIKDAIRKEVDRLVYVAGPKAAMSAFVLEEWRSALEYDHIVVIPILRLGDYTDIPPELSLFHCEDFRTDATYIEALHRLITSLKAPLPAMGPLFAVPRLPAHFLPRPELMKQLKDSLLVDLQTPRVITSADACLGVHGMGGIGKTVLACAVARDRSTRQAFPDGVIWVSCGRNVTRNDLLQHQQDIARYLKIEDAFDSVHHGQSVLCETLSDKAILIVVDDVWHASDLVAFDILGPRGRLLLTTRDIGVLHTLNGEPIPISLLGQTESLRMLADATGIKAASMPIEAHEVVLACGGLPLALALSGGMTRKRGGDFHVVLERLRRADLDKISDREAIEPKHRSIWRTMHASVDELPTQAQTRFTELAVFNLERPVVTAAVATLWSQTGNLSALDTDDLLIDLAERSLIELHEIPASDGTTLRAFSQHDLLHDYIVRAAGDLSQLHQRLLVGYGWRCHRSWASGPDDGYFFENLCSHLHAVGRDRSLTVLLCDFRWMTARLVAGGMLPLLRDYEIIQFPEGSDLGVLLSALRMAAPVVSQPVDLAGQLYGHLISHGSLAIRRFLESIALEGSWLQPVNLALRQAGSPLLGIFYPPSGQLIGVAISHGGQRLVAVSANRSLTFLDLNTSEITKAADDPLAPPLMEYRNPKGIERLWERSYRGRTEIIPSIGLSASTSSLLATFEDGTAKLWSLEDERPPWTQTGVVAAAFSRDGQTTITAEDGDIVMRDTNTGHIRNRIKGAGEGVVAVVPMGCSDRVVMAVNQVREEDLDSYDLSILRLSTQEVEQTHPGVHHDGGHWVSWSSYDTYVDVGGRYIINTDGLINAITVTMDDRYVVSASRDHTLSVWDIRDDRIIHILRGHSGTVNAVAAVSNTTRIVTGSSDGTVKLWDIAEGKLLRTFTGHPGEVYSVAVTPDGKRAVSADEEAILIWDLAFDKEENSFLEFQQAALRRAREMLPNRPTQNSAHKVPDPIDTVIARPGHNQVLVTKRVTEGDTLSYSPGHVSLCELSDGTMRQLHDNIGRFDALAITPNGRQIIIASTGKLSIREIDKEDVENRVLRWEQIVMRIEITPDGKFATCACTDGSSRVVDLELMVEVEGHADLSGNTISEQTYCMTADASRIVHVVPPGELSIRSLTDGEELRRIHTHSSSIKDIAVKADGTQVATIAGNNDSTICIWDLDSGDLSQKLIGHVAPIESIALTHDGSHLLSAGGVPGGRSILAWNIGESSPRLNLMWHFGPITSVAITSDGRHAVTASEDKTLKIWDLKSGVANRLIQGNVGTPLGLAISPDNEFVVFCNGGHEDNTIRISNLENGMQFSNQSKIIGKHEGIFSAINSVCVLSDGRYAASASADHTVRLWDLARGSLLQICEGHTSSVNAVVALPDGERLVSAAADNTLMVWHSNSGKGIRPLLGHTSFVNDVTALSDGRRVVSAGADRTLRVWDVESGYELSILSGHTSFVNAVAAMPDSPWLVSVSADRSIRLWDVDRCEEIAKITAETGLLCCTVAQDGTILAGGEDGWLYLLRIRTSTK
jgi:WD40 repeat protein